MTNKIELDLLDLRILVIIPARLTYEEMAEALGYRAKSGIFKRIKRLEFLGLIESKPLKSRSRRLTDAGRNIVDTFIDSESSDNGEGAPERLGLALS